MQGLKFHGYAGQDGATAVGCRAVYEVDGNAGAGIDNEAVLPRESLPGTTGSRYAVGAKGVRGGVVKIDGEPRAGGEDVQSFGYAAQGRQVIGSGGAQNAVLPVVAVAYLCQLSGLGGAVLGHPVLVEERPFDAGVAYVDCKVHPL